MKVKVESVITGSYGYDSIIVTIDKKKTDIVFDKEHNVKQYEGKHVELDYVNGTYTIAEAKTSIKK